MTLNFMRNPTVANVALAHTAGRQTNHQQQIVNRHLSDQTEYE